MPKLPDGGFVYKWPHDMSASVHAVIPVSRGGRLTRDNCVPAHMKCNRDQGNRLPMEDSDMWIEGQAP